MSERGEEAREGPLELPHLHFAIMEQTRIPLQKWFVALSLMINAKKSLSSSQGHPTQSEWMQQRIRTAMASEGENTLVEAEKKARPDNGKSDHVSGVHLKSSVNPGPYEVRWQPH